MIDPITEYILQESKDENFPYNIRMTFSHARGLPGGENLYKKYRAIQDACEKKEELLKKQGKREQAEKFGWQCSTKATCDLSMTVIGLLKKYGYKYCEKYEADKKSTCLKILKDELNDEKNVCAEQMDRMRRELGGQ